MERICTSYGCCEDELRHYSRYYLHWTTRSLPEALISFYQVLDSSPPGLWADSPIPCAHPSSLSWAWHTHCSVCRVLPTLYDPQSHKPCPISQPSTQTSRSNRNVTFSRQPPGIFQVKVLLPCLLSPLSRLPWPLLLAPLHWKHLWTPHQPMLSSLTGFVSCMITPSGQHLPTVGAAQKALQVIVRDTPWHQWHQPGGEISRSGCTAFGKIPHTSFARCVVICRKIQDMNLFKLCSHRTLDILRSPQPRGCVYKRMEGIYWGWEDWETSFESSILLRTKPSRWVYFLQKGNFLMRMGRTEYILRRMGPGRAYLSQRFPEPACCD